MTVFTKAIHKTKLRLFRNAQGSVRNGHRQKASNIFTLDLKKSALLNFFLTILVVTKYAPIFPASAVMRYINRVYAIINSSQVQPNF